VSLPKLRTVPSPPPPPPAPKEIQLELPVVSRTREHVVVVGYPEIDYRSFREFIVEEAIRAVVDVRGSPSFYGGGFSRPAVMAFLSERAVKYVWMSSLVNPFVGTTWDRAAMLARYVEHLMTRAEDLCSLRDLVERGPVLLLGDHRDFRGSEAEAIIDALKELKSRFTIAVR
jgi:hypothetical protein